MTSTIIETTPDEGVIYKASESKEWPNQDLLTVLFETSKWSGSKDDNVLHVAADDPHKSITKSQAKTLLKRTGYTLRHDYGIGSNGPNKDVVLCFALGHWMLPNIFYSTIAADGIFSASSPSSTPAELAGQMKMVRSKLLVCTQELAPIALAAAKLANLPLSRVLCLGEGAEFELINLENNSPISISKQELDWRRITDPTILENSVICVLFSSGTTGLPKGVKISHTNVVAEAVLLCDPVKEYEMVHNPGVKECTLAHLPAAHIAGVQGYLINTVYAGGTVYWMKRFDFPAFLRYVKKYRVSHLFSVPPVFLAIAKSDAVTDQFKHVRVITSGAAPMDKELQNAVEKKLSGAILSQVWGLSETTGAITAMPRGVRDETGSVAMLVSNCQARIVDDEGRDVKPGEPGEVWLKGPVVTKGYWENAEADREAFVDGWFCSGDVGVFRDGKFYIVDRKKELIKYKGMQVAPAELEAMLVRHPQIQDAAVIGVSGEGTEVPRAFVIADQRTITAEEIVQWVNSRVANHKKLRGGVVFVAAVPRSPAGKILRKTLREVTKIQARL